ncbi:unnamed protein product [Paramecium octaurelia]|uniref:Calcineurin-like phosphoesterase domain-containing protein n=1 Tax=Paramecium octaurelia TaxID=43137 RepID=A0A8S1SLE9_PAROT|nr:unnamed protein product [Paramecium octaurelia]
MQKNITFVCISDTHGLLNPSSVKPTITLPQGDVLIHCGDFTNCGELDGIKKFKQWLIQQPFKYKILIAGNHDLTLDNIKYPKYLKDPQLQAEIKDLQNQCIYLLNSSCVVEGYKIWGSPYSLEFCNWGFELFPKDAQKFWSQIEEGSDIVVTHGPSYGHGDYVNNAGHVGDKELLNRIKQIKAKYHLFGHIHEGYGITEEDGIKFANCSLLDEYYKVTNGPIVFQLPSKLQQEN